MRPHSFLWHYLWIAPHALQLVMIAVMIRRNLHREFPMFFTYTVVQIMLGGGLLYLDESPSIPAISYWRVHYGGLVASSILRFGVIYELFTQLVNSYPVIAGVTRRSLRWTVVILLLMAAFVSAFTPGNDHPMFAAINTIDRGVDLMQCGLLIFLFVFSCYFRLSWKSFVFGIAAGLGIFSAVNLAVVAVRIVTGPAPGNYTMDFISMATYHVCVLIWLVYASVPHAVDGSIPRLPTHNLEEWNKEMRRLLAP